ARGGPRGRRAGRCGADLGCRGGTPPGALRGARLMFRRNRFADVISRQLDLFERDYPDVIEEAAERYEAYNAADRDEAEELFGDYIDSVETGTEILADIRDAYARTLEEGPDDEYEAAFNRAVAKRLPRFALEIENRRSAGRR